METREGNNSDNQQRHSKKRKSEDENEDDDDDKVEEFFALLRSTREARDRLRSKDRTESEQQKDRPRENEKVKNDVVDIAGRRREKIHGVWSPTFRPEDFLDGEKLSLAGTSQSSPNENKEENIGHVAGNANSISNHKGNLDLNLSL